MLELEAENERLRAEVERTRAEARDQVAEVERRNRAELVPVPHAVVLYEGKRRRR